ncbi:hypothetical protein [Burkholderia cepacia]|uniref:hypothetical protein n=1 Tax=Burkholderia cepacia TaxID=292 RepID=UPI000F59C5BE|nr:hypothetical protein [Burkholderia cepacia]
MQRYHVVRKMQGGAARYGRSFKGMSPAGSLIVGAIVLVPACQPRRRPSVDASPVVALAAGTGGERVHHLLSARADARFGRHDGAQACLRKLFGIGMVLLGGVAVGIGVARARVRRCRRGRNDVAVTTVRAAARLTPAANPAAQRARPSRCGQRSVISDQ